MKSGSSLEVQVCPPRFDTPSNPDRAQLAALAADPPALAHAARLDRERARVEREERDRASLAADHFVG